MFNITKFNHDAISGIVDLEVSYNYGKGLDSLKGQFNSLTDAERHLNSCRKTYVLFRIGNYVDHKLHIAKSSNLNFYKSGTRLHSVEKIKRMLNWGHDSAVTFKAVCVVLPKIKDDFINILPIQSNPSYQSSLNEVNAIFDFISKNILEPIQ